MEHSADGGGNVAGNDDMLDLGTDADMDVQITAEGEIEGDENESVQEEKAGLLNIPVQAFLHMLQYLDAKDIGNLSATCRQCNSFCNDQLLWKSLLQKDMLKWSEVSHGMYPTSYTNQEEDVDYKNVYLRCNPDIQHDSTFNLSSIPRLLWSFLPHRLHRTPIVVMFGPGLETDTSTIVRKFITGHGSDIIKVNGVFPAMYPGSVGTGFEVTVNNKSRLRLVVLYSATRKEREAQDENQPRMSKLIKRISPSHGDASSDASHSPEGEDDGNERGAAASTVCGNDEDFLNYEPNDHVKAMCRVVGGFLFVVNASQQLHKGSCSFGRPELFAFMNKKWTPERKPLLVLSSIAKAETPRIPCVKVADQLSLHQLTRPWKVVDCEIASLAGLSEGIEWLVSSA